jgi:hypothetical protein
MEAPPDALNESNADIWLQLLESTEQWQLHHQPDFHDASRQRILESSQKRVRKDSSGGNWRIV